MLHHFVDPFHWNYRQFVLDVLRNFHEVLLILLRDEHLLKTPSVGRQQLLFQPSDRQYLASKRDLASHSDIGLYRDVCQCRHQRSTHANSRTRSVLRSGPFRHMNVHIDLLMEALFDAPDLRPAAYNRHRCLDGFGHYFAQLARVGELAFTRNDGRFDGEKLAADLGPG